MTTLKRLDALDHLLASCAGVSPETLQEAARSLEHLRALAERVSSWRRAELLQIVCALASNDQPPSPHETSVTKIEAWASAKVRMAQRLLTAVDESVAQEYGGDPTAAARRPPVDEAERLKKSDARSMETA